eukprot:SAG11_NODE_2366_length_3456_cov_1.596068_5_plen_46_part_00
MTRGVEVSTSPVHASSVSVPYWMPETLSKAWRRKIELVPAKRAMP